MLVFFMILCAVAAILLFAHEVLADLHDVWKHPDHHPAKDNHQFSRSKPR